MNEAISKKGALCDVCPRRCRLENGQVGACKARVAKDGKVVCGNYGKVTSLALDPVEKKPLGGFMPGSNVLSVGSYGCNFACPFCQNAAIAQAGCQETAWRSMSPAEVVDIACRLRSQGTIGIAYTYNEPLVGYEWVRDCARLAKDAGLVNVVVTNGGVLDGPLEEILPFVDAFNVDVKGPDQAFYDLVGGNWETVRSFVETVASCATCHLEVTTLLVPGLNDQESDVASIASWLGGLDRNVHYHLSRFFPCYRMRDRKPTSVSTVYRMVKVAKRYLENVHPGNC